MHLAAPSTTADCLYIQLAPQQSDVDPPRASSGAKTGQDDHGVYPPSGIVIDKTLAYLAITADMSYMSG